MVRYRMKVFSGQLVLNGADTTTEIEVFFPRWDPFELALSIDGCCDDCIMVVRCEARHMRVVGQEAVALRGTLRTIRYAGSKKLF